MVCAFVSSKHLRHYLIKLLTANREYVSPAGPGGYGSVLCIRMGVDLVVAAWPVVDLEQVTG